MRAVPFAAVAALTTVASSFATPVPLPDPSNGVAGEGSAGAWPTEDLRRLSDWTDPCPDDGSVGGEPDHSLLTQVLQEHVKDGEINGITTTVVDYDALRQKPSTLRSYLAQVCVVDIDQLTVAQKLATYINAYNAWMLAMVVHFDPPNSVLEISDRVSEASVWKHKFGTVGGTKMSLDDIEHGQIRSGLSAEFGAVGRIHASVNCASVSCPDLHKEAFESSRLSDQLDEVTRSWLENPSKNPGMVDGTLELSMIFSWYASDFVTASGSAQEFAKKYNSALPEVSSRTPLDFADYDWNLNAANATGMFSSAAPHFVARGFPGLTLLVLAPVVAASSAM